MDERTTERGAKPMVERDGPVGRCASDGQPYVILVASGPKPEGSSALGQYFIGCKPENKEQATEALWRFYNQVLDEMKAQNEGKILEWRRRPTVEEESCYFQRGRQRDKAIALRIYSRLAFVVADVVA